MAVGITNQFNMRLLQTLFGRKSPFRSFGFVGSFYAGSSWSSDTFSSNSSSQIIKLTVEKMQAAISRTPTIASGAGATATLLSSNTVQSVPEPTRKEIDTALAGMGGLDAISKWVVDGKTKVNVNGRKAVVDVNGSGQTGASGSETTSSAADLKDAAAKSIGRFGLDAKNLDGDAGKLRESLKFAAERAMAETPAAASAIEYALEDAFANLGIYLTPPPTTPSVSLDGRGLSKDFDGI